MIKQNLINERQDVEDIEEALNTIMEDIIGLLSCIEDCKDENSEIIDEYIPEIKKSYKEILKKILQKVDLESKYYDLTLDERIK